MFDFSYCDVICYIIYVICSLYVRKAISPLFAWPSSNINFEYKKQFPLVLVKIMLNFMIQVCHSGPKGKGERTVSPKALKMCTEIINLLYKKIFTSYDQNTDLMENGKVF